MRPSQIVAAMKAMGFNWDSSTIGIKFDRGQWNINAILINDDGTRKPVYGFLGFDSVDEVVEAQRIMMAM